MIAHGIDLVLDVGANDGSYGREIRDAGYKGQIISFEPNLTVYGRLKERIASDPNWTAHPFALGESNGQSLLSIAENDLMSSFKSVTEFGRHTGAKQLSHQAAEIVRLDTFIGKQEAMSKNIYLKIDTQGYEKEVILGASELLRLIRVVQAEIALIHTYQNESDWLEMCLWMRQLGFEVATAICNSRIGAQVREFDFVFVRQ